MKLCWIFMTIGILIGILLGVGGAFYHDYQLEKCEYLASSTNQDYYNYELRTDCYFILGKTDWHFFWCTWGTGIIVSILLGLMGFSMGNMVEDIGVL